MAPIALADSLVDKTAPAREKGVTTVTTASIEAPSTAALLKNALAAARARFERANPMSRKQHEIAAKSLPGGNTRSLLHTSPFPLSMKCGQGPYVIDEDGHKYLDLVGELTAGIYGHSHPVIREAIMSTFDTIGLNLGATTVQEERHASLIRERFNVECVRFTNSGTEATMHALGAARRFTGRRQVVVFTGGYHGAVFSFGSGIAPNNVDRGDWVLAKYNDIKSTRAAIEGTPDIAAVLVEGMQGAGGCILATKDFMLAVQESAKKARAIFILDEVMTSRLAPGGLQSLLGLKPDMTTFGKYLGGGFAFGAFSGRADIMSVYDPRNRDALAHSGTFNNNTMAMYVGYAGLAKILTPEVNIAFNSLGDAFREKLRKVTKGTKCAFTGRGAILAAHFTDQGLQDIGSVEEVTENWDLKDLFWFEMLEDGFWITRRGSIALIIGTPQEDLDRFVGCVERFLERHRSIVSLPA